MKINIRKRYYKSSRVNREPAKYYAVQPGGIGKNVHATVRLDPILKKESDLRKAILNHEENEIRYWGKGLPKAHLLARKKEPRLTRNIASVKKFWQEIKKRKQK